MEVNLSLHFSLLLVYLFAKILFQYAAHTESSARMLERTLKMVFPSQPVTLIIAMTSDKDFYNFCTQLLPGLYSSLLGELSSYMYIFRLNVLSNRGREYV